MTRWAVVAQMVEHLAVNEVVPGSSPGDGAFRGDNYTRSSVSEYHLSRLQSLTPGVEQTSRSERTE